MRRFQFPLARLQRVRELGEELARSELLAAESTLHEAEARLEHARGELRGAEAHEKEQRERQQDPVEEADRACAEYR